MKKFYLDVILLVMMLAVMNFHFLPKILHEIIGVALAVALIVHIYWNLRALRSLHKFYLAVDILMLIGMSTVMITGVIVSHYLFNGIASSELRRTILVHQLHDAIPFALIILIGLHLGRNWLGFHQRLKKILPLKPAVEKIIAGVLIGLGIVGVYMDQLLDRLMMHHIFGTAATQAPLGIYFVLVLGMIALFTAVGIFLDRAIKKI